MTEPRVWSCRVSGASIMLANRYVRQHWAERDTKVWRGLGFTAAAVARFPRGLPVCDVSSRAVYPSSKIGKLPDTTSWYPTTKAILDGFVDYGCWDDDNAAVGVRQETYIDALRTSAVSEELIVVALTEVRP